MFKRNMQECFVKHKRNTDYILKYVLCGKTIKTVVSKIPSTGFTGDSSTMHSSVGTDLLGGKRSENT